MFLNPYSGGDTIMLQAGGPEMTLDEITKVLRGTEAGHFLTVTLMSGADGQKPLAVPLNFTAAVLNHEFEGELPRNLHLLAVTFIGSDQRLAFDSASAVWLDQNLFRIIAVKAEDFRARHGRINSVLVQVKPGQTLEVDLAPEMFFPQGMLEYKPRPSFREEVYKKLCDEDNPRLLVRVLFKQPGKHLIYQALPRWIDEGGVEVIGVRIM